MEGANLAGSYENLLFNKNTHPIFLKYTNGQKYCLVYKNYTICLVIFKDTGVRKPLTKALIDMMTLVP